MHPKVAPKMHHFWSRILHAKLAPPFGSSEVYDKTTRQKNRHFFEKIVFLKILSKIEAPPSLKNCSRLCINCSNPIGQSISKKNQKSGRSRRVAEVHRTFAPRRSLRSLSSYLIISRRATDAHRLFNR